MLFWGRRRRRRWSIVDWRRVRRVDDGLMTTADTLIRCVELRGVSDLNVVSVLICSGPSKTVDGINDETSRNAVLGDGALGGG